VNDEKLDAVDLDALQRLDPRLVALAHGRIDEDELDELLERALEEPAIRRAVEAFWPLDDATRTQSFARAQAALAAQRSVPSRPRSPVVLTTGVVVFLAGVLTWLGVGMTPTASLPSYALEVRGGYRAMRAAAPRDLGRMTPDAPLELVYRPANPVAAAATAAIFVVRSDEVVQLEASLETSSSGAFRWQGTVGALLPQRSGEVELVVAARPGDVAPSAEQVRVALEGDAQPIRVTRTRLFIEAP
jgi:hypothetical protein